ncbi:hypothetical protein GCM10018966_036670 [Streptomyces yanii]
MSTLVMIQKIRPAKNVTTRYIQKKPSIRPPQPDRPMGCVPVACPIRRRQPGNHVSDVGELHQQTMRATAAAREVDLAQALGGYVPRLLPADADVSRWTR